MASNKRVSIYVGEPLAQLLHGFEDNRRSGRLNSVAERYLALVADEIERAAFSRDEWCAIFDVLNGCQIEAHSIGWPHSWVSMEDSPEVDRKWGVNHADLAARMRALSPAGRAAVWEAAVRFWSCSDVPNNQGADGAGRESEVPGHVTRAALAEENRRLRNAGERLCAAVGEMARGHMAGVALDLMYPPGELEGCCAQQYQDGHRDARAIVVADLLEPLVRVHNEVLAVFQATPPGT